MFVTMAEVEEYVSAALANLGPRPTAGTVVAGSPQLGPPINVNPYFELDLTDWTAVTAGSLTRSSAQAHQGTWSARLVPDGASALPRMETQLYPIDGTHRHQVAAWVRADTANKNIRLYTSWHTAAGVAISTTSLELPPTAGEWMLMRTIIQPPDGAGQVRLGVGILSTPAVGDAIYVDEATLHDVDAPRPPLQVVMDGSALAVPVKQVRGVPVAPGMRVALQKVGSDPRTAEWVSMGPLSDPATGTGNRMAVGADIPAELAFFGVSQAHLFFVTDVATGTELGYFFQGLSNTLDVGNQQVLLWGHVAYPTPGDPTSAAPSDVQTHFQMNLNGYTIFKDHPVQAFSSVPWWRLDAGVDFRLMSTGSSLSGSQGRGLVYYALHNDSSVGLAANGTSIATQVTGFTFVSGRAYRVELLGGIIAADYLDLRLRQGTTTGGTVWWEYYRHEGLGSPVAPMKNPNGYLRRTAPGDLVADFNLSVIAGPAAQPGNAARIFGSATQARGLLIWDCGDAADFPHATAVT